MNTEIELLKNQVESLKMEIALSKRNEAATWDFHASEYNGALRAARREALDMRQMLQKVCAAMLPEGMATPGKMAAFGSPWRECAEVLAMDYKKEMASTTPIDELIAKYEEECCDFSDIHAVAQKAARYASTMRDGQARCLLYILAKHIEESNK